MRSPPANEFPPNPAPADARPHAPWPLWRKVAGYLLLAALAGFAIWYVDVKSQLGRPPTGVEERKTGRQGTGEDVSRHHLFSVAGLGPVSGGGDC